MLSRLSSSQNASRHFPTDEQYTGSVFPTFAFTARSESVIICSITTALSLLSIHKWEDSPVSSTKLVIKGFAVEITSRFLTKWSERRSIPGPSLYLDVSLSCVTTLNEIIVSRILNAVLLLTPSSSATCVTPALFCFDRKKSACIPLLSD